MIAIEYDNLLGMYNIQISINGVQIRNEKEHVLHNFHAPVKKITIHNKCKMRLKFTGPPSIFGVYDFSDIGREVAMSKDTELTANFEKAGDYFIYVLTTSNQYVVPITELVPFTITFYTFCDSYCLNPAIPNDAAPLDCPVCGNGIYEEGE